MIFREETIDSKLVYDGKVIKVCEEHVRVETGNIATREIVMHRGAVDVVALTDDNKIVLEKQYRKAIDDVVLEIPAGKIEHDDDDIKGRARTELMEETGFDAKDIKLIHKSFPSVGYSKEEIYFYLATELTPGKPCTEEGENIEILLMDFDEAYKMAKEGKFLDAKSTIGILLAYLNRHSE